MNSWKVLLGHIKKPSINDVTALEGDGVKDIVTSAYKLKKRDNWGGGFLKMWLRDVTYVQPLMSEVA